MAKFDVKQYPSPTRAICNVVAFQPQPIVIGLGWIPITRMAMATKRHDIFRTRLSRRVQMLLCNVGGWGKGGGRGDGHTEGREETLITWAGRDSAPSETSAERSSTDTECLSSALDRARISPGLITRHVVMRRPFHGFESLWDR